MRGGWLSENEVVRAVKLLEVSGVGLQGHDASLPPCVAATWLFSEVVGEMSSCCLEGQQMVPSSMWDVQPDVARQSTAMLLFASGKVVSGCVANAAQLDVLTASR
jgi:hypothetical protein